MEDIFIKILNMSITASYFVPALLIVRVIFRKMPKWISCLLWGLVGLRLILPFSFESILSIIPSAETVPSDILISEEPHITSGIPILNSSLNPIINEAFAPEIHESVNPLQVIIFIAAVLWLAGITGMLLYALISYILLQKKTEVSFESEKGVFICDYIDSPFILGVIKPKIYIPSFIGEDDKSFILAHEKAHIKRKDYLWKPLGFLILSLHWFNPLMWLAYILLCRDIEGACDEKVIKEMEGTGKKAYSEALINCASPRKLITACPLAFGETDVKQRIKNVLNYKKPAFWIVIIALVIAIMMSVFFLTNPRTSRINSIEDYEDIFRSVEKLQFKIPESYVYTTEDPWDELRVLKRIRIDPEAINDDRSTDRDSTYKIEINDKFIIYIDSNFSQLWLDDIHPINLNINISGSSILKIDEGELPSLSYRIENPEILKKLFEEIYTPSEPTIGTETSPLFTDFEGVYVTLKSIDTNIGGYKVFNLIWNNTTDTDITYGESYDIEIKNGENWESVATEDLYFNLIGYILKADSTEVKEYSTQRFDISKTGTYRLVASFSTGDGNIYQTYIEFQINNSGGDISDIGGVDGPTAIVTTKKLTLTDVIMLSEKGDKLSWEDFEKFSYIETGSGLYIRKYEIDERFSLLIGGSGLEEEPMYIYLSAPGEGTEKLIDIRSGNVMAFIEDNKNNPIPEDAINFVVRMFPVDNSGDNLKNMIDYGSYAPKLYQSYRKNFPTVRIQNEEDLDRFYKFFNDKMDFNMLFKDTEMSFSQAKNLYNVKSTSFFDEHNLLIVYASTSNELNRFEAIRLLPDDRILYFSIRETVHTDIENEIPTGWLIVTEVPKEQIKNIKDINAFIEKTTYLPEEEPESEPIRVYMFLDSYNEPFNPNFALYEDGTFVFNFSPLSSYYCTGTYRYEGDKLILDTRDGLYTYTFTQKDDTMVFDAKNSSEKLWNSDIKDGSVFN